ncbi:MAG: tetratricopeptide repeat protein [Myxococcota bacterium]
MQGRVLGGLVGLVLAVSGCKHSAAQEPFTASASSSVDPPAPLVEGPEEVERALVLVGEGRELAASGLHAAALARFEEARQLAPSLGVAHLEAAMSAQRVGASPQEIEQRLDAAVAQMPTNPRAQYQRAALSEVRGDVDAAIRGYRLALTLRDDTTEVWLALARTLLQTGAVAEAREAYGRAVNLEPRNTAAHLGLAESAERLGDVVAAERALRTVQSMLPGSVALQRQLVAFFERTGQRQKAQAERTAMERAVPKDKRRLRPLKPSR